jgi:hypothetical protein
MENVAPFGRAVSVSKIPVPDAEKIYSDDAGWSVEPPENPAVGVSGPDKRPARMSLTADVYGCSI